MEYSAKKYEKNGKITFSLHVHAKSSFAYRLQTASSHNSAQNNGPRAQRNDGLWVQKVLLERKIYYTRFPWL